MKAGLVGCIVGLAVAVAAADDTASMSESWALTTIDELPTRTQLDGALGSDQEPTRLIAIAEDGSNDTGVRLRAISALPHYCPPCGSGDAVPAALRSLITADESQVAGQDVVLLRAAIESLAQLKDADDLGLLGPLLNHPSRDIRASAARALGVLCNSAAIDPLRERYQNESTEQVKLAISAALRILPCQ